MQHKNFIQVTWVVVFLFFAYSIADTVSPASNPQTKQIDEIHEEIQVDLVNVYLTATDSKGAFVTDLKQGELTLKEDGVPQQISNFAISSHTTEPLTVVILIDTSLSMNEEFQNLKKIEMAKKGAVLLINQLKGEDKMLLIRFSDAPSDAIGLVSQKDWMKDVVRSIKTDNGLTALLDAVNLAIDSLKNVVGQKVIFICSDGEDTASKHTTQEILESLKNTTDLTVVTLGINAFQASRDSETGQTLRDGRTLLQSMADNTGGYAFFPKDLKELDRVMTMLKSLIGSQYSLGYHPTNLSPDDAWKKIEISCSRPGVTLRYRTGYSSK